MWPGSSKQYVCKSKVGHFQAWLLKTSCVTLHSSFLYTATYDYCSRRISGMVGQPSAWFSEGLGRAKISPPFGLTGYRSCLSKNPVTSDHNWHFSQDWLLHTLTPHGHRMKPTLVQKESEVRTRPFSSAYFTLIAKNPFLAKIKVHQARRLSFSLLHQTRRRWWYWGGGRGDPFL